MIEQGRSGKITQTLRRIAGRQGYAEFAPYCASKAGVISLTQAAAREMAKHKITVNGIAPGVVRTPLWDGLEQDMIDRGVIKQKGEFISHSRPAFSSAAPRCPMTSPVFAPSWLLPSPTTSPARSSCVTVAWY